MESYQLMLGWLKSPIIRTWEKPMLFAWINALLIFASFEMLLLGDQYMQPISNLSLSVSFTSHHTLSSSSKLVISLFSVAFSDTCV